MSSAPPRRLLVTGPPVLPPSFYFLFLTQSQLPYFNPSSPFLQGVGKTTLITNILEKLRVSHPHLHMRGFYTREKRRSGERIGFEIVTLDGRCETLASSLSGVGSSQWPCVGKYKVDVPSFEGLALPELELNQETDLFVIDEVGKMELFSSRFFPAVFQVFSSNIPVLASIPIPKYGKDIPQVAQLRSHADTKLYTLNKNNRDDACLEVYNQLRTLFG